MSFNLSSAKLIGPALPEPFVKFDLEKILNQHNLLPKTTGEAGKILQELWDRYRRKMRDLGSHGGKIRVRNHIIDPLIEVLGYASVDDGGSINTREGDEDAGFVLKAADNKSKLRIWTVETGIDLEAPVKRGYAYRFSYMRIAQRVLLAAQERMGILTNGIELRILISDSARPDSQVVITIDPDWKRSREVPDTFRFLIAIVSPKGIDILPEIVDKARLRQTTITKELRIQARQAIEGFIQEILGDSNNKTLLNTYHDKVLLAKNLWHEGLITVYRLLFILKGEASDDPAKSFGFTGSSIWRNTYSPTVTLIRFVRKSIDEGADTGNLLEQGLRIIFKMFAEGVKSIELNITPLGGALFGENSTPLLSGLHWPERSCAKLLDKLLWTLVGRRSASQQRERIHYGSLDIEDLGRVYEALLELEPGITSERMCRLRRSKLEVVVPYMQGEKYRTDLSEEADDTEEEVSENGEEEQEESNRSTKVKWIEEIRENQFYLRVGLGRKSSGSFYTPHSFVRFLVKETLGPKIEECSPKDNPYPNKILQIKVLDPAMGSGHFLVEACRFMAERLYEACRLCDEKALELENKLEKETDLEKKIELKKQADEWRNRILEIPDPQDEILKYLPSSAPEGISSGFSQSKALALCKRLVAVHCLYGVDKNPLAVELAKLSLWLESQSEGFPLTFLDHRLVIGDSITGPFFEHLLKYPGTQESLDNMFHKNLKAKLTQTLSKALLEIKELEKSVDIDLSDITSKQKAKERLENCLLPFKILAAAWTGGVMLGQEGCDDMAYANLARIISDSGSLPNNIESPKLLVMISKGLGIEDESLNLLEILQRFKDGKTIPALSYDLTFPEVFFELTESGFNERGFDVVLGNPPWDRMLPADKEFFAGYQVMVLDAPTKKERDQLQKKMLEDPVVKFNYQRYVEGFREIEKVVTINYSWQIAQIDGKNTIGKQDLYRLFMERKYLLLYHSGVVGLVVPSAFHANEGATGIRRLYLEKMALKKCFSFENKKKLFEIHSSFKFALIIAQKETQGTNEFSCAFYLHDEEWLFRQENKLTYSLDFVRKTGGLYLSILELRSQGDYSIAENCYDNGLSFGRLCDKYNILISRELNVTDDRNRVVPRKSILGATEKIRNRPLEESLAKQGLVPVHEGKTFWQYDDQWGEEPNYIAKLDLLDKDAWLTAIRFYRPAVRKIARATDQRTSIWTILPPGFITNNSAHALTNPTEHSLFQILLLVSIGNSFCFDWLARQQVGANLNLFILFNLPLPWNQISTFNKVFLSQNCLRLICNHVGFAPLWNEQLGDNWREPNKKPFTWPVLATDEERWEVRSAIDAVVADAYGLNREQYEHVLHSFDRASGPNPYTGICLSKFDELKQIGLDAFTKKYDPYWDIPLNEELPKPVIDLPIPEEAIGKDLWGNPVEKTSTKRRGRKR